MAAENTECIHTAYAKRRPASKPHGADVTVRGGRWLLAGYIGWGGKPHPVGLIFLSWARSRQTPVPVESEGVDDSSDARRMQSAIHDPENEQGSPSEGTRSRGSIGSRPGSELVIYVEQTAPALILGKKYKQSHDDWIAIENFASKYHTNSRFAKWVSWCGDMSTKICAASVQERPTLIQESISTPNEPLPVAILKSLRQSCERAVGVTKDYGTPESGPIMIPGQGDLFVSPKCTMSQVSVPRAPT